MFQVKGASVTPLKEYISNLSNQGKEGFFFKMFKENKNILLQSIKNENPVERYVKGLSEKKIFDVQMKGTFLNIKV